MSDAVLPPVFVPAVHPLDDVAEQKLFHPAVGRMHRTLGVRAALMVLRLYVAGMVLLGAWHAYASY